MALTAKQQAFIDEYLKSRNATQAAIAAGYSEKTAYSIGWENLRKPEIAEVISQRVTESAMSAEEVMERLAKQARADIGDFLAVGESGVDIDLTYAVQNNLTDLIKKLTHKKTVRTDKDDNVTEETFIQIELHDAHAALVDIGRHHALFTDKSITGNYDIDLSKLTNEQLDRVANGEDPMKVVLDGYIASTEG